jgi:hypothetical protein
LRFGIGFGRTHPPLPRRGQGPGYFSKQPWPDRKRKKREKKEKEKKKKFKKASSPNSGLFPEGSCSTRGKKCTHLCGRIEGVKRLSGGRVDKLSINEKLGVTRSHLSSSKTKRTANNRHVDNKTLSKQK